MVTLNTSQLSNMKPTITSELGEPTMSLSSSSVTGPVLSGFWSLSQNENIS